jgi:DUF1680 family protein
MTFGLQVRIPGWCREARLTLNGAEVPYVLHKGYARVMRTWQSGEHLVLHLPMPVERVYPHPAIRENVGKVALRSGPLIYCVEAADHSVPLHQVMLPADAVFEKHAQADLPGITVLRGSAYVLTNEEWHDALYRFMPPSSRPLTLTAIPYYAWGQRTPGEMRIWLHTCGDHLAR